MSVTSPIKHRPGKASLLVQVHAVPSSRQPLQQHPPAPRHRGISKGLVLLALAVAVSVVGIWKMESLHRLQGLTPLVAAPRQQQQEQQQQQQELAVSKLNPKRLLLATHSRLMWYYPDTQAVTVLHEGEGVHYGMFPGAGSPPTTVWTALRPHNWRPATSTEWLVELDMVTGQEVRRVQIDAKFTHEVVRAGDRVYVCDTGNGRILELAFPDMTLVRTMPLFSLKDHPNTLAPLGPDNLLVVLHNLGTSDIVRVDTTQEPPAIAGRLEGVGTKAHGLVPWRNHLIMLDSDNGALIAVTPGDPTHPGGAPTARRLWKAPEEKRFLKGLAVMDDVAYFGVSAWAPRAARDDPSSNCQLAAYDLVAGKLLWRREVPTAGLLNIVGAPHLDVGSTYTPTYTPAPRWDPAAAPLGNSSVVATTAAWLTSVGYPPKIGGYWSSGLPFLDNAPKWTKSPWDAGFQLPLFEADVKELATFVEQLPPEMWTHEWQEKHSAVMGGRDGNMAMFKPGVEAIVLLFSAGDGTGPVYQFPAYELFAPLIEPLVTEIIGAPDVPNIIRMQLALMKPNVSDIKIHVDAGGYAQRGHRIHVPLYTNEGVLFNQCPIKVGADGKKVQECYRIPTPAGFVFELNNRVPHKVANTGPTDRVHLVVDVTEEPHPRVTLSPGTVCDYDLDKGLLCRGPGGQVVPVPVAAGGAAGAGAVQQGQALVQQAVADAQQ